MDKTRVFNEHRSRLFGIAYRMLGTIADAEDALQDAWLKWDRADVSHVQSPGAYLVTIVTRICIDLLRSARSRREVYRGSWLPEPLVGEMPEPDAQAELADSVSMALLVLLERLTPAERAAFLLREVFAYDYASIASILDKNETACRQLVTRAKRRIDAGQPRFEPSPEERERLTLEFFHAVEAGDADGLAKLLGDSVVLYADGGGKAPSAINPIYGPAHVAKFLLGVTRKFWTPEHRVVAAIVNGTPGAIIYCANVPETVLTLSVHDNRISGVYIVRNPDKLRRVAVP